MRAQLVVAYLDLREHRVEPVDQRAHLVVAGFFDTTRVVLVASDRGGRIGEPPDRRHDDRPQPRGQCERYRE